MIEIANAIYEVKDVNNIKLLDQMDGFYTLCACSNMCNRPFAGICFAAYDAELGFVSEAYPSRESLSIYGQATYNAQDNLRYILE